VRGEGNYSYRLYESLAAGRIPAYLDTGAALPLESIVPWDDLCVVIAEREARQLDGVIAKAHRSMPPAEFTHRQTAGRDAWERWLSMRGYFGLLHERLNERARSGRAIEPDELAASLR
jgi:hypothetical protein